MDTEKVTTAMDASAEASLTESAAAGAAAPGTEGAGTGLSKSAKKRLRKKRAAASAAENGSAGADSSSAAGDGSGAGGGEGGVDGADAAASDASGAAGKKKKKRNKKKKGPSGTMDPPHRGVGGKLDYFTKYGQTFPPSRTVASLFGDGHFPQGEISDHPGDFNTFRVTSEEKRAMDRANSDLYETLREASEVHRQVRAYANSMAVPGVKLWDLCCNLEDKVRELVGEKGLERGMGFPTGCSLNHVAAHYTPNPGDDTTLSAEDVMKLDFGVQINGRIIDCAWTVAFDEKYDSLLQSVKEATNTGLAAAGIDVQLGEIGAAVQEVMESYELELDGKSYPIKAIRNLNGHSIEPYHIHGGKSVPIVKGRNETRMEEGEVFAIETFGSTGRGEVHEDMECSHYMKDFDAPRVPLRLASSRALLKHIDRTYSTLPWCKRWLDRPDGGSTFLNGDKGRQTRYAGGLRELVECGIVNEYPPLVDIKGSYTAQYEHTFILRPTCKEILSRGDDF
jgi:methionyl aminopeptidase